MSEEQVTEKPEVEPSEDSEIQAEAQETEQSEDAATSEEETQAEKPKKQKSGLQQRIDQITREKYELQHKLEQQQAESEQYRQAMLKQQMEQAGDIPMPKLDDYGYDEVAYTQAVQQWHQAKVQAQTEQQQQLAQQQAEVQRQQQKQASLMAKLNTASEKYPDFIAKVNNPQLPSLQKLSPAAFEAVIESDKFADVSMYLANNPSELYEFHSLSPIQAVRRIAELEMKVSSSQTSTTPPPAPPSTIGGKGESVKDPDKMSTEEWMAWRNAQLSKR